MRHLVISDLHEDYQALYEMLDKVNYDDVWFLGDAIGLHNNHRKNYQNAEKCLSLLQEINAVCVSGNWEMWLRQLDEGNQATQWASTWWEELQGLEQNLSPDLLTYIQSWPQEKTNGSFSLFHGSPYQVYPDYAPYETHLDPPRSIKVNRIFATGKVSTPYFIFGHTHLPGYFHYNGRTSRWIDLSPGILGQDIAIASPPVRYAFNPGSLGGVRAPIKTALLLNTAKCSYRFLKVDTNGRGQL